MVDTRRLDGGQSADSPTLMSGEVAVANRQDAVGHQQLAQVFASVGHGQGVEPVVAERHHSGGDAADALAGCPAAQPRQPSSWHLHGGQRVDEGHELGVDPSGSVVEEAVDSRNSAGQDQS